ncbi:hypothetical protein CESP606_19325 [Cereibacter sphaeroides]
MGLFGSIEYSETLLLPMPCDDCSKAIANLLDSLSIWVDIHQTVQTVV